MFTKIVCTIGPASQDRKIFTEMVKSGMRVARLNFSHGTYPNHKLLMKIVRDTSEELKVPLGIMQDLQGPKIRIGKLKKPVTLAKGATVTLGRGGLPVQFDLSKIVAMGQQVLIDDGLIRLHATKIGKGFIECAVDVGGQVISHKGINVPESKTNFSVFTEKDRKDLRFGLKNNVDFVAMSFVRSAKDILEVKKFIRQHLPKGQKAPWVVAKVEKSQAMQNIDEIIAASDVIMVARGDLGIEAAAELVPVYQKTIVQKCLASAKPVIVATQMLDSMIRNPKPTRAESSDVANAVFDNADCVMLSGESAFGRYPKEAVAEMGKIVRAAERSYFNNVPIRKSKLKELVKAVSMAKRAKAPIVLDSSLGDIAILLSNFRQEVPVFVHSSSQETLRKLTMVWGVHPLFENSPDPLKGAKQAVLITAKKSGSKEILVSAVLKKL